jgi:hypothetical protein
MKEMLNKSHYLLIFVLFFTVSCKKNENEVIKSGKIHFIFSHNVDGSALQQDTILYTDAAGNPYMITELQYFISDVVLYRHKKEPYYVSQDKGIHYIDIDIPSTLEWNIDGLPIDIIDSVGFTFGLNDTINQDMLFTDPPESLMFWPDQLGGGYHYMKMNGKWLDDNSAINPFNFHLGIGQVYDSTGSITGFVQNYFKVTLPNSSFQMTDKTIIFNLEMNINQWFKDPNTWDFNFWGGSIMQNEEAMHTACENGHNVFSAGDIYEE